MQKFALAALKGVLLALSWGLRALPEGVRRSVAAGLGALAYRSGFRRNLVEDNLRAAFPELSTASFRRLVRDNYRHYGLLVVEFLTSLSWGRKEFARIPLDGVETARALLAEGRGFFFVSLHLGCWELLIGTAAAKDLPVHTVVKRAKSHLGEALIDWCRRRTGGGVLDEDGSMGAILKEVGGGRAIAYLMDQFMGPPLGLPVKFFGRTAGTAVSLAAILERRPVPLLLSYLYRDSGGKLRARVEPPFEFGELSADRNTRLYQRTQRLNDALEAIVRRHPDQWLWIHRRWKPFQGQSRYPVPDGFDAPGRGSLATPVEPTFGSLSPPAVPSSI